MNKRLIISLKFLVVAVLLGVIYVAIDWHDSYTIVTSEGGHEETVFGEIIGPWDTDPVLFRADGESAPKPLQLTGTDGQPAVNLSPGILTYFSNLNVPLFLLGAAAFFSFVVIVNSRWWWLMRANGLGVGFFETQRFAWIGLFCSNVLPGATGGDIVKAVFIVRRCSGDKVRAVVSVVVDRIVGLLSLLTVCSLSVPLVFNRFPLFAGVIWLCALGVVAVAALLLSPRLRRLLRFEALVQRLPLRIATVATDIDHALLQYRAHLSGIGVWILVSPLTYSLFCLSVFLMDRALGVGLSLADYFVIVPVAAVAQAIPIAPAGWGIGEAAYGALIGKFGAAALPGVADAEQMMRTRGVALSVLHRTHVMIWSLAGGVLLLVDRQRHPSERNLAFDSNDADQPTSRS